jgi:hypothetical protein
VSAGRTWLVAVVALVVLALVAGARTPPSTTPPGAALGPGTGEQVSAYTARAAQGVAEAGAADELWALLSPATELDPGAAAALVGGVRTARVLLRVPLRRVQTPLDALQVADQGDLAAELTELARLAGGRQVGLAQAGAGRAAAVAQLVGTRLESGCACVVGLVLHGTGEQLRAVAARAGVRAVEVAPPGTGYGGLSVVPLLPEQTTTVGPGPDDGVVPETVFPSSGLSGSRGGG